MEMEAYRQSMKVFPEVITVRTSDTGALDLSTLTNQFHHHISQGIISNDLLGSVQ